MTTRNKIGIVFVAALSVILIILIAITQCQPGAERQALATPGAQFDNLTLCGTRLCNTSGQVIQLRGVGQGILDRFPTCLGGVNQWNNNTIVAPNTAAFYAMANTWHAGIVRLGVQPSAYALAPDNWNKAMDALINAATAQGLYVLVDWHVLSPGNPLDTLYMKTPTGATVGAFSFFAYMASTHKDKTNILWEIANEPNGSGVTWSVIKSYAEQVIPVIRKYDPDGIIIVGTEHWSQDPRPVAANPITGYSNIMYTIHAYPPGTSYAWVNYLAVVDRIPIFSTEWGGMNGGNESDKEVYTDWTWQWMDMLDTHATSHISWMWADNGATYSHSYFANRGDCSGSLTGLTEWGRLAYDVINAGQVIPPTATIAPPTKTLTPTFSPSPKPPTATITRTATPRPTDTPRPTNTPTATYTPIPTATYTPTYTPTRTPTKTPTPTATPLPCVEYWLGGKHYRVCEIP